MKLRLVCCLVAIGVFHQFAGLAALVTFTVTNTLDSGPGSFRQALSDASGNYGGSNYIAFNVPGAGEREIIVLSPLPNVPPQTLIDGYSQPGTHPNTLTNGDDAVLLIEVRAGAAISGTGLTLGDQCTVRGLVVDGFSLAGILAQDNAVIIGNFIGTDASGCVALGNDDYGIETSAGYVRIGSAAPADRNIISGNHYAGVYMTGGPTSSNLVQGNYIGTDITGQRAVGNSLYGVVNGLTYQGVPMSRIGGTNANEGNIVAFSQTGVWIMDGQGCAILGNSIFGNHGLGIDLGYVGGGSSITPAGPTPNDPGDTDTGANGLQNYPIITSVIPSGGNTIIQATLNSAPNVTFRVEFFANPAPDPSGYGQGQTFLGAKSVTTDGSGNVSFSATFSGTYSTVAATATDASGNTSEFSPCNFSPFPAPLPGDLFIKSADGSVQWRRGDGTLVRLLNTGIQNSIGSLAFDSAGNLYVAGNTNSMLERYDSAGNPLTPFTGAAGYSSGIDFDQAHRVYVSDTYPDFVTDDLQVFSGAGTFVTNYTLDGNLSAVYSIALAPNQRTVYFDGFVNLILSVAYLPYIEQFDLVTGTSSVFYYDSVSQDPLYTICALADGGLLVTTDLQIRRINAAGQLVQTYDAPGEDGWDPIALDADGRSFWAASYGGSYIYKFDLATGAQLLRFDSGVTYGVAALAVRGAPDASTAGLFLGMTGASANASGRAQTFTLTLLNYRTNSATGVNVTNTLPLGFTFNSATTGQGTFTHTGNTVSFNLGTVTPGTNITMTVTATPASPGSFTNLATVTALQVDPSLENNTASYITQVQGNPGCPLVVTTTADSGAGSLRAAINCANATPGLDTITFSIPGSGVHTISPLSPLPPITDPVVIDGYTQPGAVSNTAAASDNGTILVQLNGASAGTVADGLVINCGQSTVRGLAIGGFGGNGIVLAGKSGNVVAGNFIGTDATGLVAAPNLKQGVLLNDSLGNMVGSSAAGDRNVISGNRGSGIGVTSYTSGNNLILGNFIGSDKTGATPLGNGRAGVLVSAPQNSIGGTNAGAGNLIAFNDNGGVEVIGSTDENRYSIAVFEDTYGVSVLGNSIYSNGAGLGIDLAPAGVTLDDSGGDQRTGPNELLNFPVLSPIVPGSTSVHGTLATIPSAAIRLELFASAAPNPSGYGEGQTAIGSLTVNTDTNGNASFSVPVSPALANGQYVTATSTELRDGDTSEFSKAVRVSPAADLAVSIIGSSQPATARQNLTYTITVTNKGPGSASDVLLVDTLPGDADFVSADEDGTNDYYGGTVGWGLGTMAAHTSTNVHLVVLPKFVGSISTAVNVQATEFEPTPADNTASLITTITGTPRTLVVTNAGDSGPGTLRAALTDVNANGYGLDTITFNIPGAGLHTITPTFNLPSIQSPVLIDGYSQPGAQSNTLINGDNAVLQIELRGTVPSNPQIISGVSGLEVMIGNTTIRGLIIDQFLQYGIYVYQYNATLTNGVVIEGNYLGPMHGGTTAPTNGYYGVEIEYSGNVRVGGLNPGSRNIISGTGSLYPGNPGAGVYMRYSGPVSILGNYIGTDVSGHSPLGNAGMGIDIDFGDLPVQVGGTNSGAPNVIAFNGGIGVEIGDGTNNAVLENSIYGNGGLGIHLGSAAYGVTPPTPNDPGDADTGPNSLQNYPVLTSVSASGGKTAVQGTLNSLAATTYRLEFYSNAAPSLTFYGQGQSFLGATNVTTDLNGNAAFALSFPGTNTFVSATATDPYGNTSEFSAVSMPAAGSFQTGDILIGTVGGQIQWRRHDLTPVKLLNSGVPSTMSGLGFDPAGRLLAAATSSNLVVRFDNMGNYLGVVSSNVVPSPVSFSFDSAGNFYAGSSQIQYGAPSGSIWKLSSSGTLLDTLMVAYESGGAGWLDLAADQRTLYYTSFGTQVKRYDSVTHSQLSDLGGALPSYVAYDLRVLSGGGALVADGQYIAQLDSLGNTIHTYTATNEYSFTGLALDPDGASFWAVSDSDGYLYKFAFGTTNAVSIQPIFVGSGYTGLAIFGEPRAAAPSRPVLSAVRTVGSIQLSWPTSFTGYTLQHNSTLLPSGWIDLPTTTNSFTIPSTNAAQFFRLIKH